MNRSVNAQNQGEEGGQFYNKTLYQPANEAKSQDDGKNNIDN